MGVVQNPAKLGFGQGSLRTFFLDLAVKVESAIERMCRPRAGSFEAAEFSTSPLAEMARFEAAHALLMVGDRRPVGDALCCLSGTNAGTWAAKLLEHALSERPAQIEIGELKKLAEILDPMHPVPVSEIKDLKIGPSWQVFRTVDCSRVRQLAKRELSHRREQQSAWPAPKQTYANPLKRAAHS